MLRLRNTRGLLPALCLDKNGMRRTQRRRQSYQSGVRTCDSLGKGGILHCLKVCSKGGGGEGDYVDETMLLWDCLMPGVPDKARVLTEDKVEQNKVGSKSDQALELSRPLGS